jgi:uncharacterized protein YjdB
MASVIISSGLSVADAQASSAAAGLSMCSCADGNIDIYSTDAAAVEAWFKGLGPEVKAELVFHKLHPHCLKASVSPYETLQPRIPGYSFFTASEVAQIYGFPAPDTSVNIVMGVMSFGGGLFGTVSADGVLTNGDVQAYWTYLGIPTNRHPRVIIRTIDNATNTPGADSGTAENTLDVETIGGACPSQNLTIILYICPNTLGGMLSLFTYMYNTPVVVGGISYTPNIISCSWGLAEVYYSNTLRASINSMMSTITGAGISICTATGDFGANNNGPTPGYYVDFPSSSPNATAVGGTRLVCQNNIYDVATVETAWTSGGGGTSEVFAKPAYQSAVAGSFRCIPDIAGVADPNTGVVFRVGGSLFVYGGTSVAAPLAAAFLAAINCRTFVNPRLYSAPFNCFHDVTVGNNGGMFAGVGYDKTTGLGSINGANLGPHIMAVAVTGVTLNQSSASLLAGDTLQLTAIVAPAGATNDDVTWSSSNTSRATVDSSGLVTAVSAGSATITATTVDGNYTATCALTITGTVAVTSVILNKTTVTVGVGATTQLVATVLPTIATDKSVTWSSSDTGKATVNASGVITGVATGSATITVTTTDGGKTSTCAVTVVTSVAVTGVGLNQSTAFLATGSTLQLTATLSPTNATNTALTWSSSVPAKATVSSSGLVTAVAAGTTNIVVTTTDGSFTATCAVSVYSGAFVSVTGVSVTPTSRTLEVGGTQQLTATVSPAGATNKLLTWSSNSASVSVSQTGLVTAVSPGPATVTVTTQNGSRTATSSILVNSPPLITMNPQSTTVSSGAVVNISATITRPGLTASAITWSSSNTSIATVPSRGVVSAFTGNTTTIRVGVTGTGNGTATITANASGYGVSGTSSVVVTTRVQSVTLNARNATLAIGQTYQAVATINPGTASNQDVTWSSSSSSVATVNADGLITAVRNGTSTIRVTTVDGGKFATLTVSVVTPVTGVTVSPTTLTLNRGATSRLVTTITPPFASNVGVKWSSSNTRVATVTTAGVVRGVAVGTATITVRTNSGSLTATCVVTVV